MVSHERGQRDPSFAAYAEHWAVTRYGESSTRAVGRSHARALVAEWPSSSLDEISASRVRAYLEHLCVAGYSASYCKARLSVLRSIFGLAIADGAASADPTLCVRAPADTPRGYRLLDEQELWSVLGCLPGWFWPAALLAHDAGLRAEEVAGLRVFRLDLARRQVLVTDVLEPHGGLREHPKDNHVGVVPLTGRLVTALNGHLREWPRGRHDHVFTHPGTERPVSTRHIRELWARARVSAQLAEPLPRFQDLRHCAAANLARAGVSAVEIARVLRHGNIKTAHGYVVDQDTSALG